MSAAGYRRFDVVTCGWYNAFGVMRWVRGWPWAWLVREVGSHKASPVRGREEVRAREAAIMSYRTTCV